MGRLVLIVLFSFCFVACSNELNANSAMRFHSQDDAYYAELARQAPAFEIDPSMLKVAEPSERHQLGVWSELIAWPFVPVSVAQLPDGRILGWASFDGFHFNKTLGGRDYTVAATWDPVTETFIDSPNPGHDMFCAHQVLLEDGRVLVSGGNYKDEVSIFDFRSNSWSAAPKLQRVRWYPTSVALPGGQVFTALGSPGDKYPELWTEGKGWSFLTGIDFSEGILNFSNYYEQNWWPLLHLAPNGKIFHSGPTPAMHYIDIAASGSMYQVGPEIRDWYPKHGVTVMYDEGKLLVAGGASRPETGEPDPWGDPSLPPSSNRALTIDINDEEPQVTRIASMKYPRKFHNGVVLPNGEVMVIGGNSKGDKFFDDSSIMTPEIWNPKTQQWRELADLWVPRNYHSVALLLPDGRVFSAGGGLCGENCSRNHPNAQLYSPPYLFNEEGGLATRPVIVQAPSRLAYGESFEVLASGEISAFSMVKLSSTTHAINTDLRFLQVPFEKKATGEYVLTAHANPNVLAPGYWMLFALNTQGVPSLSKIVQVSSSLPSIVSPGHQMNQLGDLVELQIQAFDPQRQSLSFAAEGLPEGLSIDSDTGLISGTIGQEGQFRVRLQVKAADGSTAELEFDWVVRYGARLVLHDLHSEPQEVNKLLHYRASFEGGIQPQFKWSFGDGSPETAYSTSPDIEHRFSRSGRYLITLTAKDQSGLELSMRFSQSIHEPLKGQSSSSSSLLVESLTGLERLWVVNPDNDSVSVFDMQSRTKLAEIAVEDDPRSLVLLPSGQVWVTNKGSSTVTVIDGKTLKQLKSLTLPYASAPHGMVFDAKRQIAYIALEGSKEVISLDAKGHQLKQLKLEGAARHLSLTPDDKLLLARFITAPVPGEASARPELAKAAAELYLLDTPGLRLEQTLTLEHSNRPDAEHSGRGLPNYLGAPAISPDGLFVWVPSKQDNISRGSLRDGRNLSFDSTVRAIASYLDWPSKKEDSHLRIDFDNAGVASAALFDKTGNYLFVALETNREVAVVDAYARRELFRFEVDRAPQGLALSLDGRSLYVHNFMERTVTLHDLSLLLTTGQFEVKRLASLTTVAEENLPAQVLLGKQLFYDAKDPRLSLDSYLSCASCHADGMHDGRTWDFSGFGEGLRNTPSLLGKAGTRYARLHWTGNFDEVQDFEGQIRSLAQGRGLMSDTDFLAADRAEPLGASKAGLSPELDALAAYISSLTDLPPSPYRSLEQGLSIQGLQGKTLFEQMNCSSCHLGDLYNDGLQNRLLDIGTLHSGSGQRLGQVLPGLQAPSLKGLWSTAPYLHDGSAADLAAALRAHKSLDFSEDDVLSLSHYLLELDGLEPAPRPASPLIFADATPKDLRINHEEQVPLIQLRISTAEPFELRALTFKLSKGDLTDLSNMTLRLNTTGDIFTTQQNSHLNASPLLLADSASVEFVLDEPLVLQANSSRLLLLSADVSPTYALWAGSSLALIAALGLIRRKRWVFFICLIVLLTACSQAPRAQYQFALESVSISQQGQPVELESLPIQGAVVTVIKR